MEVLKEKINFVVKSFGELEFKFERSELEWMAFKDNWMEEKSMYLHRITFLENYISSNWFYFLYFHNKNTI